MSLLVRSSLRYLKGHPWLTALSVLGVAIGVAMVVSIDLANISARRAFQLSAASVTGRATHQIVPAAGGLLPDSLFRVVRVEAGLRETAPVVTGFARHASDSGRVFQLLGIDPLSEAPFRSYVAPGEQAIDLGLFMARQRTTFLSAETAREVGVDVGDTLALRLGGQTRALYVAGLLDPDDEHSAATLENLLVMDVSTAQELLRQDGLSHIDLLVPDDERRPEVLARAGAVLPPGAEIVRSSSRTETVEQMTRAFEVNLTALSLLALVVGMFLIYNTITFSVVQRRPLIGRLRALGVTRREIFSLVLGEALVIGTVGTLLGLALGVLLGRGLVGLVTQTINDLYYVVTVRELSLEPLTIAKGLLLGLVATAVTTLFPAFEATRAPATTVLQRSYEETRSRRRAPALALAGALLAGAGVLLLLVPTRSLAVGYTGIFLLLVAFALATPVTLVAASSLVRPLFGRLFGLLGRMAASGIAATLSRTGVAVAALMIAVSATIGVGVMVNSFRSTIVSWLEYSLQADVYVQPPSLVFRGGDATLPAELAGRLAAIEGVAEVYTVRRTTVSTPRGPADLVAVGHPPERRPTHRFKAGDPETAWPALDRGEAVLVSEPYSYHHGLGVGDTLRITTDRGLHPFPVAGIFYDYTADRGVVLMSRRAYDRFYDDRSYSGLALEAVPGTELDALVARVRTSTEGSDELLVRSNRRLRELSLEVFDRTFTITRVLRLLALLVAFIGVLSALMALQLERSRELGLLRAMGMTPEQVGQFVTLQTGLMGLLAGLLSVPLGLLLAYVLIFVINKRSFGWTLQFEPDPGILLQALLLAVGAALLAGLYPAWKMARTRPALALREE